jgi:hypothetical protein
MEGVIMGVSSCFIFLYKEIKNALKIRKENKKLDATIELNNYSGKKQGFLNGNGEPVGIKIGTKLLKMVIKNRTGKDVNIRDICIEINQKNENGVLEYIKCGSYDIQSVTPDKPHLLHSFGALSQPIFHLDDLNNQLSKYKKATKIRLFVQDDQGRNHCSNYIRIKRIKKYLGIAEINENN